MSLITTPTFIIGLGGVGNTVARLVHHRYESSGKPLPDTVRIRSIDTAAQPPGAAPALPDGMFTRLGDFQANEVINRLDLHPEVGRWWKYPAGAFAPGFIENGAGARRPVGRLVFFQQFKKIVEALRGDFGFPKTDDVQEAMIEQGLGTVKNTPRVFIIGSLAGGTCSGTFLDVAMLVRHLLRDLGYEAQGATITGILGLPSMIHLASGDRDSRQARQRQVNALAALTELDGLMGGLTPENGQIEYPQPVGVMQYMAPVFNQVYLVTERKSNGVTFTKQDDVLQRMAHFVFAQVALGMGQRTLDVLDNFKRYFDPSERAVVDGLPAIYGSFGVEWLEVPHLEVIARWSSAVAIDLARHVNDFEYGEERPQNLDSVVRSKLTGSLSGYLQALDVVEATPQSLLSLSGLDDVAPLLSSIQSASTRDELQRAMQTLETQVPALLDGMRRAARQTLKREETEAWVQQLSAELIADKSFRLGGARRVLLHLVSKLESINRSPDALETVEAVVRKCGGTWLRKLDQAPAAAWAQDKVLQQARAVVKAEFGPRALDLAEHARQQAEFLESLKQALKTEAQALGQQQPASSSMPADSWLLSESEIAAAIESHRDEVIAAVAQTTAEAVAKAVSTVDTHQPPGEARDRIASVFATQALAALEHEAVRRTRRPDDTVQRIVQRLEACEPMAHIINHGNALIDVMQRGDVATPLKMVLTEMEGDERRRIEEWARNRQRDTGAEAGFQVSSSADPLRDDALHLTFGWPLWLFHEVQECSRVAGLVDRNDATSAMILGEFPDVQRHEIKPLDEERSKRSFSYALVLGWVTPVRTDRITFSQDRFGMMADASGIAEARVLFRRRGLNRRMDAEVQTRESAGASFKADVRSRLAAIRAKSEVPAPIKEALDDACRVVEADIEALTD